MIRGDWRWEQVKEKARERSGASKESFKEALYWLMRSPTPTTGHI